MSVRSKNLGQNYFRVALLVRRLPSRGGWEWAEAYGSALWVSRGIEDESRFPSGDNTSETIEHDPGT